MSMLVPRLRPPGQSFPPVSAGLIKFEEGAKFRLFVKLAFRMIHFGELEYPVGISCHRISRYLKYAIMQMFALRLMMEVD